MSDSNAAASTGGIGFFGLLGIAFIVMKLTGFIDWSWWWVLAPIWGPFLFWLIVLSAIAIAAAVFDR